MAEIKLKNLSKRWGSFVGVDNFNLTIKDQEFLVLLGPSGCGKTTTMRMIAGLEDVTEGDILIDNARVNDLDPKDRDVAMVFQSYALYPNMNVYENIRFPLKVRKIPEAEHEERVMRASAMVELDDFLHRKPAELSGGQRQRVALARAIVREPNVFLMDEPLSNLDAKLRVSTRAPIKNLSHELKVTTIYVTHDQIEAMTMADRIVVLNNGRVEQFGTPMELYHHPATKFVASFIGQPNMNFLSAKITGADSDGLSVQTKDGLQLQLPVETGSASIGQNVDIGIRPENITQGSEGLNLNVSVVERLGGTSITYGATDAGIRLCAALDGVANVREGETVELAFDPKDCHVFDAFGTVMRRLMAPDLAD